MRKIGYGLMFVAALVGVYGVWASNFGLIAIWIVAEIIGLAIVIKSKKKVGE